MTPDPPRHASYITGPTALAITAAVYFVLAQYILFLNDPVSIGAAFWPAGGFTLGMLLLLPHSRWLWVIGGIILAEFGGNALHGYAALPNAFWTLGNIVSPLIGACLIRRFASPHGELVPLRNLMLMLVFGVLVAPPIGASIGSIGTLLATDNIWWQIWPKYVIGDMLGVLVTAPLLLAWTQPRIRRTSLETVLLVTGLLLVCWLAFRNWPAAWDVVVPYLIIPFLTWAALRYGIWGAALAIFVTANIANVATAYGFGPFALYGEPLDHAILLLQIFLIIVAITTFIIATQVNDIIARVRAEAALRHDAIHDVLTGLHNRRGLDDSLRREIQRVERSGNPLSLIMFDLDHFKICNDTYGHTVGDNILQQVTQIVSAELRGSDLFARWGGEEFVVVLPDADEVGATQLAERIRAAVENARVDGSGRITISLGVATHQANEDAATLIGHADKAVYKAKTNGRNRVEID